MALDNSPGGGFDEPQVGTGGRTKIERASLAILCAWVSNGRLPTTAAERTEMANRAIALAVEWGVRVTAYETA